MESLRLIAALLDYPTEPLYRGLIEVHRKILADHHLSATARISLIEFIQQRRQQDLLDWQSDYDGLFEKGRALSLHLFEHVHGESRDRGQAMVDLLAHYREAGLELSVKELPDYLPVYLEFASTQSEHARDWLMDVAPILALLQARLEERECNYALLFKALLSIAQVAMDLEPLREQVAGEEPDDTPEALDKIWEEEAVSFTGNDAQACPSSRYRPSESQRCDDVMPVQIANSTPSPAARSKAGVMR